MSFFSEERGAELRELFFESAAELLQSLNEEGLRLEQRPDDAEIIRSIRRNIHTLKGDSAACGYAEISSLAHDLEDVLTPEVATGSDVEIASLVLRAADAFNSMLSACRSGDEVKPEDAYDLRKQIKRRAESSAGAPASNPKPVAAPVGGFAWSEYEQLLIHEAASQGSNVFAITLEIDPHCPMRAAALQLIRNVLQSSAELIAITPDQCASPETLDVVEVLVATPHDREWLERKCMIPAVVSNVTIAPAILSSEPEDILLLQEHSHKPVQNSGSESDGADREISDSSKPVVAVASAENILRVDADRIDAVLNLVGELIIGKSMLMQAYGDFDKRFSKDPLKTQFSDALGFQARVLNDLQKAVMKIRMVPVEQLFRRFPRSMRDLAKACGKDVQLLMAGQDTDLDKSVLDALAEPLAHLVRNAVDHGIESPDIRAAAGKPQQGAVRLDAYHLGNQVVIEVSDDGGGIDRSRLTQKAIERGILRAEDLPRMSDSDILELVFHPGLSTAERVTEISGRGVGMDVVKSALERLKGSVQVESKAGGGTRFLLRVPLTLAIINALLFRVAGRVYAVPLASVVEITRAEENEVHRVDQHEVIRLRDQVLTLVRLSKLSHAGVAKSKKLFVVVIAQGERRLGLAVDQLIGEEELVIKALDDHLVATELVSGASIRGDGSVVLILNVPAVVQRLGRTDVTLTETLQPQAVGA